MTENVGTLLRRLRDRANLTQEQVAHRSGVSERTIRRLESGGSMSHRTDTLNRLADALELGEGDRLLLAATLAGGPADPGSGTAPGTAAADPAAAVPAGASPQSPAPAGASSQSPAPAGREPGHRAPPVPEALADAVRDLATEVRRRWRREEEQRRVHDPFPLPVRWTSAPAALVDRAENIQRLGPGEELGRVDLDGDLRSTAHVYRRIPSGRLVVLGRAGSGKSVLTIRLALDLLDPAAPYGRVPVIFSVGSWDPSATALRDWMIGRLLRDHPHLSRRSSGGATLAAALIDADLVLPVLDGFDEIAEGLRPEALDALNASSLPLVLTSRREEYAEAVRAARSPLVWAGAVELTDLTPDDLADYLPRTARAVGRADDVPEAPAARGSMWDAVLAELRGSGDSRGSGDPAPTRLAAVLATPLMVVLARTLYSESASRDPAELLDPVRFPSVRSLEEHLLAGFVPAVYRRRPPERDSGGRRPKTPYADPAKAERRLGHLAHHLVRLDHERQDLAWWRLGRSLSRWSRIWAFTLATAVSVTLAVWIVGVLLNPLTLGAVLLQGLLMGPAAGLTFGAVYALTDRYGGEAFEPTRVRLTLRFTHGGPVHRPLRTVALRSVQGLLGGTVAGIGCACALTLERALVQRIPLLDQDVVVDTLLNMVILGLIFGSAGGLVFGAMGLLEAPVDVMTAATPVSLLAANRATAARQFLILAPALSVTIAVGGYLIVELLRGVMGPLHWEVADSVLFGAACGLGGAASYVLTFTAWGQWLVLARIWLPLAGRLPWDPAAFLDDAYRRGVLRQTGAVYQFRHARLQHHLGRVFRERHPDFAPTAFDRSAMAGRLACRPGARDTSIEPSGSRRPPPREPPSTEGSR
ncbi:helix-turn-helix domain-containing protein [Streptomyces cyaneofuscatus]|uniref:helix-turn-helix domain-containing protein n=1 Tax=Streptomyces cyaneofuscatus TaxID=66883 RepID=UPI0013DA8100|nr:helix-turn-helix domain-containing protein [Streptomyces cyaneofuscatus]NDZ66822.1 XRE family transcriptional regulator [Streptomyces cyaneofuscatus]